MLLILCTTLGIAEVHGQNTYWASKVEDFSSERESKRFSANQVLGEPNAYPNGKNSPVSWSPSKEENKKEEFIKVSFKERGFIQQVVVAQNFNPGSIEQIYVFNTNDRAYLIYENDGKYKTDEVDGLFRVILPALTSYKVRAVKVILNTKRAEGFNCIDAIGISDAVNPIQIGVEIDEEAKFLAQPENLGKNVNSNKHDYIPQISPDGRDLYFARKEEGSVNIWNSKYQEDGSWSEAKKMGAPLNNGYENYVYTITPDGNTVLLGNSYTQNGSGIGASTSLKKGKGWAYPVVADIDQLMSVSKYNEFFLGPNKKVMLMTLQNSESYGATDVFVSFIKSDKSWTKPKNLGPEVNTADVEASPFLAADNRTLYFASRGHRGYGKSDIFVTKRIGDGWDQWTKPKNLGDVINTKEGEYYYSVPASGEYAYYVSKNKTLGGSDIFRVKLPNAIKPKPVTLVYGNVYNAKTNQPISAEILYEVLPEGIEAGLATSNSEDGSYKIVLPVEEKYGFFATKEGFLSVSDQINLKSNSDEYTEIRRDLYLVPIEVGQKFVLNNILFDRSEFALDESSIPELRRLVAAMQENPTLVIKLNGHTDNRGSRDLNQKLSESRVQEVKKYLTTNGVLSRRVQTEGYGSTQPLNQNESDNQRRENRRVELEVVSYSSN